MKLVHNKHGAVSVFLALILVPVIAFSCVFVDLARVQMSKSVTESSADLALNTLLTNYDADLSEYYGLIGSCQTIDEFYKVSAEYFLRTISSQDLSDAEITTLAGMYSQITNDDTISDLLQIKPMAETDVTVSAVKDAHMGNPTFLKDSIVEFMKYRGPIEIATNLLARLESGTGGVDEFLQSDENKPLTDAKEEFYESEGELLEAAIQTYLAIQAYEKAVRSGNSADGKMVYDVAGMKADENKIVEYRKVYEEIYYIALNNRLNTEKLKTAYTKVALSIDTGKNYKIENYSDAYSSSKKAEDGTTIYYVNNDKYEALLNAAKRELEELKTAVNTYVNVTSQEMKNPPATKGDSATNAVQWWLKMESIVYSNNVHSNVASNVREVQSAYDKLMAMQQCEEEPAPKKKPKDYKALPSDWKAQCQQVCNEIANYRNSTYDKTASLLATISQNSLSKVKGTTPTVKVDGKEKTINDAIPYISTELTNMYKTYKAIVKVLDICIDGNEKFGGKVKSLDGLLTLAKTYSSNYKTYKDNTDPNGTKLQKKEHAEVNSDKVKLKQEINETSVKELKTRLVNIRSQFKTMMKEIEDLTFGGLAIKDITKYSTFKTKAMTVVQTSKISTSQSSLDAYWRETLPQLLKPTEDALKQLKNTEDVNYNPDLNQSTPKLYQYMKDEFKDIKEDELKEKEEDEANAEAKQKEYESEAEANATKYRGPAKELAAYTDNAASLGDALGSMVGLFKDLIDSNFDGIRDDMYVTTYIMEMFTYASYDREAMYRMLDADQRTNMFPDDADKYYKDCGVYGDASGKTDDQRGKWVSTDLRDNYNKSLTNKLFCDANNKVHTAEVEYVLYGNASPAENLKKAYGNIYAIRFAMNTISAFDNFWSATSTTGSIISSLAASLSGLTGGVVPAPVFKAVILPIMAALESCKDNSRLFAGMPVELYKVEPSDWWISFEPGVDGGSVSGNPNRLTGLLETLTSPSKVKRNKDQGLFYSDYITVFVYCALSNSKTEKATYERLERLIEGNMGLHVKGFDLDKTKMYFQLTANLQVKPLMVTLPYYFDEYEHNLDTATDWCSYKIKAVRGYT